MRPQPLQPFFSILIPLATCVGVVVFNHALYLRGAKEIKKDLADRETIRVDAYSHLLEENFKSIASHLAILSTGDELTRFAETGRPESLDRAANRALFLNKLEADYDQIRFLDERGQEQFRVANHSVIPKMQLSDLGTSSLFQKAQLLTSNQIFLSSFRSTSSILTNQSASPTPLSIVAPVFDRTGKRGGAYVIDFLGERILSRWQNFVPNFQRRLRILDAQGSWIKNAGGQPGAAMPTSSFAQEEPGLWQKISRTPKGQVRFKGGLFTWEVLRPEEVLKGSPYSLEAEDGYWIIASQVTQTEWASLFIGLRNSFLLATSALVLLIVLCTIFFLLRQRSEVARDRFFTLIGDNICVAGFDGYFKRLNPAWEASLGYSLPELLTKPFLDFVHPEDREKTISEFQKLLQGGELTYFENRYQCKDGSYRCLLWSARAQLKERLIYASARDLTEHKKSEQHIQQLNDELKQHANTLELVNHELESFSYSVSHDLRAPLRHVVGFIDLLARYSDSTLDETERRYLAIISNSARNMGQLIDELLVFSKMGRTDIRRQEIELGGLIESIINEMKPEASDHEVIWKVHPLPVVQADLILFRQVWINLISNALKYSRPRRPARIEIGYTMPSPEEQIFFIRDNGVGFDMKYADKLFGVFQRLHRTEEFQGTGIGLANVRRIISRHGGKTWAEGQVDLGATVYFSLPKLKCFSPEKG